MKNKLKKKMINETRNDFLFKFKRNEYEQRLLVIQNFRYCKMNSSKKLAHSSTHTVIYHQHCDHFIVNCPKHNAYYTAIIIIITF